MTLSKLFMSVALLTGSATAFAGTPEWKLSESSGPVMVSRPGFQAAAVRGGALRAGDTVSTGKAGRAVLVRGDEYLVVSPGSRIVIAEPKTGSMTQIIQSLGSTLFKIKKMATPHFAVQTPYLAAVVKGTTFSVTVTGNGASVQVTEGRVQVATPDGGASYMVTPGEIGIVNRNLPFRLTVQGRETVTIDSPAKPADGASAEPTSTTESVTETASALDAAISDAVSEGSVTLDTISGGMISGDSSLAVAQTSSRVIETALLVDPRPQTPEIPAPTTDVPSVPVIEAPGQVSDLPPAPPVDAPADNVSLPGIPAETGGSASTGGSGSSAGSAGESGSNGGAGSTTGPGEANGGSSDGGKDAGSGASGDGKGKGGDDGKDKGGDDGKGKGGDDGKSKGGDDGKDKGGDDGKGKGGDDGKGKGGDDGKGKGGDDGKDKGGDDGKGKDSDSGKGLGADIGKILDNVKGVLDGKGLGSGKGFGSDFGGKSKGGDDGGHNKRK